MESLADRLQRGPLPLAVALECFADVAQALRDLHAEGGCHGQVNAGNIVLTPAGAELRSAGGLPGAGDHADDAAALGALIFQVFTGARPMPGGAEPWAPRVTGPRSSPANIRASALQLARRAFTQTAHDWAKESAELRLLSMLARQAQRSGKKLSMASAAVAAPALPPAPPAKSEPAGSTGGPLEERIEPAIPAEFLKAEEPPAAKTAVPDLPDHRRCPGCDSADVHQSKPRTRLEKMAVLALKIPLYRCHQCYHRWFLFFRLASPCTVQKVHRRSF